MFDADNEDDFIPEPPDIRLDIYSAGPDLRRAAVLTKLYEESARRFLAEVQKLSADDPNGVRGLNVTMYFEGFELTITGGESYPSDEDDDADEDEANEDEASDTDDTGPAFGLQSWPGL